MSTWPGVTGRFVVEHVPYHQAVRTVMEWEDYLAAVRRASAVLEEMSEAARNSGEIVLRPGWEDVLDDLARAAGGRAYWPRQEVRGLASALDRTAGVFRHGQAEGGEILPPLSNPDDAVNPDTSVPYFLDVLAEIDRQIEQGPTG